MRELPQEIRRFEPVHTLTDKSPDGLGLIGRATAGAGVAEGGRLAADRGQSRPGAADRDGDAPGRVRRGSEHGRPGVQGDARARGTVAGLTPSPVPYGAWPSPISADRVARASVCLSESLADGDATWWIGRRPDEGGRYVVMRTGPGTEPTDVLTPWSARTRVHEYGGGAIAVHEGVLFFTHDEDQRLYRKEPDGEPVSIAPAPPSPRALRYADMDVSPDGSLVACVRERHSASSSRERAGRAAGRRVSRADGRGLGPRLLRVPAVVARRPPARVHRVGLPADAVGQDRAHGRRGLGDLRRTRPPGRGGPPSRSSSRPGAPTAGCTSSRTGQAGGTSTVRRTTTANRRTWCRWMPSSARPMWMFGYSSTVFLPDGRIACLYRQGGVQHLALLDPTTGELLVSDLPFASFEPYLRSSGDRLVFVAGAPRSRTRSSSSTCRRAIEDGARGDPVELDESRFAEPRHSNSRRRADDERTATTTPTNPDVVAPDGERPLLVRMRRSHVRGHAGFDLAKRFFTSRGFAYVDVNYGGLAGYGRQPGVAVRAVGRRRRRGREAAARYLVGEGLADPDRLLMHGGSAGGWTTLCALTFGDVFATGTSYYGVSDLEPFATFTHKFEFKYNDMLVGPWPRPRSLGRALAGPPHGPALMRDARSLAGRRGRVVPPSQADLIVEALEAEGAALRLPAVRGRAARVPGPRTSSGRSRPSSCSRRAPWVRAGGRPPAARHPQPQVRPNLVRGAGAGLSARPPPVRGRGLSVP